MIYLFIYTFHIPSFVILSGLLSQNKLDNNIISKYVNNILLMFIIFNFFYELFYLILNGHFSHYIIKFSPFWIMWYLLSLFIWRLSTPIFSMFNYSFSIAVLISFLFGYFLDIGRIFNIARTIYFFPFFIAGYYLNFDKLEKNKLPIYISFFLIAITICLFYVYSNLKPEWLWGIGSYIKLMNKRYLLYSGLIRLQLYFLSFIVSFAIFSLISKNKCFFTNIGKNSLFVYVWHGFFILLLEKYKLINYAINNLGITFSLFIFIIFSLFLSLLLSSNFIKTITNKIIKNLSKKIIKSNKINFSIK